MKYLKIGIFIATFLFIGVKDTAATTTISQLSGEALSRSQNFSTVYQQLGTNLSGTLTSVDLKWFYDSTFYGIFIRIGLIECDSSGYSPDPVHCSNGGESVVPEAIPSFSSRVEDGIKNTDIDDYVLDPNKYYFIKIQSGGPFGSMGVFSYYGSQEDTYFDGSLCSVSPFNGSPCINNELISDLYFVLYGVSALPPCTEYCYSSILFLPGLKASRLYGSDERLWEPDSNGDVENLFLDESGTSVRNDIYAKDVIDEAYSMPPFPNIYKSFLENLNIWKNNEHLIADFSAVPYDWRLTIDEILSYGNSIDGRIYYSGDNRATTTPYIISELRRLAETSGNGRVSIVAHSNGGLVAKALLKKLQDENDPLLEKIDNVFLVAVPQTGTPQAIATLLHGADQGLPWDWFSVFVSRGTGREFGKNMPGAYPLLPSSTFWNNDGVAVGLAPIRFDGGGFAPLDQAVAAYGGLISTKDELWSFLKGEEGRTDPSVGDISSPSVLNDSLLSYGDVFHEEIDGWIPPSYIAVHQIAGWGEETLASIVYRKKDACLRFENHRCLEYGPTWTYKPELVIDGDGTVVVPSALAMSTSYPNIKRWWVDLKKYDTLTNLEREHKDILEVPGLVGFIKNRISTSTESEEFVVTSQPPSEVENRLYFYLHSPLDLSAMDNLGNIVSSTTSAISGARYKRFGEVQYISIPKEVHPTINLVGFAPGSFDLEIEEKINGVIMATSTFVSIPTATTTVASMRFDDGTIENASPLSIDYENDGEVDITLEPVVGEIVTLPPVVIDTTAPEAKIVFSTTTNSIKILGTDDATLNPIVNTSPTSTIISDEGENSLKLKYSLKNKQYQSEAVLSELAYSTTTQFISNTKSLARYYWLKNLKTGRYLVFVSHLKTADENIITIYDPLKDKTNIISISKTIDDIDLENVVKKLPKGAIIKKTMDGLVITHLETKLGKVSIKY